MREELRITPSVRGVFMLTEASRHSLRDALVIDIR